MPHAYRISYADGGLLSGRVMAVEYSEKSCEVCNSTHYGGVGSTALM